MTPTLEQMKAAREIVALAALEDPDLLVIFARLDHEIAKAEAQDPITRARALASQRAMA